VLKWVTADAGRNGPIRASVSPMPISAADLESHLRQAFPDAEIAIEDLAGDGDHYRARISSRTFAGLTRVKQHQLVYAALKGVVGGALHALALETTAPSGRG
jgi:stress-induced morphogen